MAKKETISPQKLVAQYSADLIKYMNDNIPCYEENSHSNLLVNVLCVSLSTVAYHSLVDSEGAEEGFISSISEVMRANFRLLKKYGIAK